MLYASKIRMRSVLSQQLVYKNFPSIRECKWSKVVSFLGKRKIEIHLFWALRTADDILHSIFSRANGMDKVFSLVFHTLAAGIHLKVFHSE